MKEGIRITPMMQQFLDIKEQHPDCILFFRAGDFYELFYDDAKICSEILNITLTKRGDVPMAGVPFHSVNPYIKKVLQANKKIAICEQLEDPKQAKGVVKRGVTQILTPGTILEDEFSSTLQAMYIASISLPNSKDESFGVVLLDISTGECIVKECATFKEVTNILHAYSVTEILYPEHPLSNMISTYSQKELIYSSSLSIQRFHLLYAKEIIKKHEATTQSSILSKLESLHMLKSIQALGAVLYYTKALKHQELTHIKDIEILRSTSSTILEELTIKNLDILHNSSNPKATLLSVIDYTKTPMGKRELKKQLISPLNSLKEINSRLDAIEYFSSQNIQTTLEFQQHLSHIADIERISTRISSSIATPKDLKSLQFSLEALDTIQHELQELESLHSQSSKHSSFFKNPIDTSHIHTLIAKAICDEPPAHTREYGFINSGYHDERDDLEELTQNSSQYLSTLEKELKNQTTIQALKIKYNKIFGYYIEIPKSQESKVPQEFILKQTLVNANRYTTLELKEKEQLILGSKEKLTILEQELFNQLIILLQQEIHILKQAITEIKKLDIALSGSYLALYHNYKRPQFNSNNQSIVKEGRNPIVEKFVSQYIRNSYEFKQNDYCKIITGPNMAGKSTFLRQVALISILAQCGQFVPATQANLMLYDSIFTRIGAHDELAQGQSTFMVEMSESAHILNQSTSNSLVIFDEIGRGTSTYDGMAIAQAIIEEIAHKQTHALFATHYHELNELEHIFEHICNYHVEVEELDNEITFLHTIKKGGVDKSYGIHVAKLAHMPQNVLDRAEEILSSLNSSNGNNNKPEKSNKQKTQVEDKKISKKSSNSKLQKFLN